MQNWLKPLTLVWWPQVGTLETAADLSWGSASFPPPAESTGPASKGNVGTLGLSRGRLRGQSDAHMLWADILPLCFPAEASFQQMLRVKKTRAVTNTVWLVRHYPKLCCRMSRSCQTLLESIGIESINQCPLRGFLSALSWPQLAQKWPTSINLSAQSGYLLPRKSSLVFLKQQS